MIKENVEKLLVECKTMSEFASKLGYNTNGYGLKKARDLIETLGLTYDHFDYGASKKRLYDLIEKICPVCTNKFTAQKGHKREKITCSKKCSNTYFRTGKNNPNYITGEHSYREICFKYHEPKCVVCEEKNVIDVHHYDENRNNNEPINLIPLCPTHHRYCHSEHKHLIQGKIEEYIKGVSVRI